MRLAHKSLDDLVAAGCTWDQAEELMRFPILKFLTASPEQLDAGMPVLKTNPNPNPNPNPIPNPIPIPISNPNPISGRRDGWSQERRAAAGCQGLRVGLTPTQP